MGVSVLYLYSIYRNVLAVMFLIMALPHAFLAENQSRYRGEDGEKSFRAKTSLHKLLGNID